jgi:hypothetical protein
VPRVISVRVSPCKHHDYIGRGGVTAPAAIFGSTPGSVPELSIESLHTHYYISYNGRITYALFIPQSGSQIDELTASTDHVRPEAWQIVIGVGAQITKCEKLCLFTIICGA